MRRRCRCDPSAGTRLVAMASVSVILHLPPLALLVQHIVLMALTANSAGYCTTQLLADPLTQRRLGAAWHVLDAVLPVLVPVDLMGALTPDGVQLTGTPCGASLAREAEPVGNAH